MEQARLARAGFEGCGGRGNPAISGANGFWRVNPLLRYERSSTLIKGGQLMLNIAQGLFYDFTRNAICGASHGRHILMF